MKKIGIVLMLGCIINVAFGQKSTKELKAEELFKAYSYDKAIKKYSAVKSLSIEGKRNLAEAYVKQNDFANAENTYASLMQTGVANAEDVFSYAYVLRRNGKYADSDNWMKKFQEKAPNDIRAKNYVSKASQLAKIQKDEGRYNITHLDINSEQQDFGTAYYQDQIVFASTRTGVKGVKRTYNWNNLPFLDLYIANTDGKQLSEVKQLKKALNNKMHEGPASFSKDGKLMAFTRNNYEDKSSKETINLELFFAVKYDDGEWSDPKAFKLNNKEYSVGHPCLSSDGKTMYFVSDMPGGAGGTDIYKITKVDDNIWGEPENLVNINTEGNEMFPFFHEGQKILFFASNGHLGLGGLDVFLAPEVGGFSSVINAGFPLNSKADDFALIVDGEMKKGYFSSNRETGKGDDDIYSFEFLKPFMFCKAIKGKAKDKKENVLASTFVYLYDSKKQIVDSVLTGEDGAYEFCVEENKKYSLRGTKEKYFDGANSVDTKTDKDVVYADVVLEKDPGLSLLCLIKDKSTGEPLEGVNIRFTNNIKGISEDIVTPNSGNFVKPLKENKLNDRVSYNLVIEKDGYLSKTITYNKLLDREGQYKIIEELDKMDVGMDLSKFIEINPIYFDYNKYYIRDDAAVELDKIVKVMNENPGMYIELGSHTDCRGTEAYNEKLSDRRAKSSAKYIKSKITNPERIYGKGYGESQLINHCACEGRVRSKCSDEEHQANRRTEFRITKIDTDVKVKNNSPQSFNR